jgi:hypothetical protein
MPAVLLIAALLLGGRIYLRHWRRQHESWQARQRASQRWENEGGSVPPPEEQPGL